MTPNKDEIYADYLRRVAAKLWSISQDHSVSVENACALSAACGILEAVASTHEYEVAKALVTHQMAGSA